ncbi:colanic acid biosynthesis protein WcaH [Jezberella montanilacus]|uniref:Colanic acid biosynthesis protein WcaH n=1 Tax=Jezberella montanilacus TaxID=323426 RepID=A0A2T0XIE0_9BURK|nr:NUDIX hydrolase [Jezberella montanilacus]PRY98667.1 colanic acid biosynthesis protein WcaH [Jezberella montanilacus]
MIIDHIRSIENKISDPRDGLVDDLFYFVGRLTPYVNVDLLIRHPEHGVLMTWRDDEHSGKGWHVPGGIIRLKEKIETRIIKVALTELNAEVTSFKGPLAINEIIAEEKTNRSHFISLLYQCELTTESLDCLIETKDQNIRFFQAKPADILSWHEIYAEYFL